MIVVSLVTRWVIIANHSLPYSGRVADFFECLTYGFRKEHKNEEATQPEVVDPASFEAQAKAALEKWRT